MMGVQVPRRVYAEVSQEAAFRQDKTASGSSVSRSGATEGVPDRGRAFDAGSRSYVDINTSQIFWARVYFVTTVGRDEEVIRAYIRNQELADRQLEQFELKISAAQNPNNRPNIP